MAIEVMAMTTKVREKLFLPCEASRLAIKSSVFNEKKSLLCKSMFFRPILFGILFGVLVPPGTGTAQVVPAAARNDLYYPLLGGKRIGVVANRASRVGDTDLAAWLIRGGINVVVLFSPEHGYQMSAEAGAVVGHGRDSLTGIRVVSLYGSGKKPSAGEMELLDLVLFDLQDVGVRFFTYISTLTYVMEACAEAGKPLVVLDRPNPNGDYVDGPVLRKKFRSFVGLHPVPVVYGMTIGEYARMVNGERWLSGGLRCDLTVIPMEGYDRSTRISLPVRPSPNLPDSISIRLYPSLCLFEGTRISVGRGTACPFSVYGHPEMTFGDFYFTPQPIPGVSDHPPYEGERCRGEDLRNYFRDHPEAEGKLELQWIIRARREWMGQEPFFTGYFEKLAGTEELSKQIDAGMTAGAIRRTWQPDLRKFMKTRGKYLIY